MAELFFVSDTHFSHSNIIKDCDRPFRSALEMDEAMIARWNETVRPHGRGAMIRKTLKKALAAPGQFAEKLAEDRKKAAELRERLADAERKARGAARIEEAVRRNGSWFPGDPL